MMELTLIVAGSAPKPAQVRLSSSPLTASS
jgi:hypothetical protein